MNRYYYYTYSLGKISVHSCSVELLAHYLPGSLSGKEKKSTKRIGIYIIKIVPAIGKFLLNFNKNQKFYYY